MRWPASAISAVPDRQCSPLYKCSSNMYTYIGKVKPNSVSAISCIYSTLHHTFRLTPLPHSYCMFQHFMAYGNYTYHVHTLHLCFTWLSKERTTTSLTINRQLFFVTQTHRAPVPQSYYSGRKLIKMAGGRCLLCDIQNLNISRVKSLSFHIHFHNLTRFCASVYTYCDRSVGTSGKGRC